MAMLFAMSFRQFKFQRGMTDMFLLQQLFDPVFYIFHVIGGLNDNVGRQGIFRCADGPNVKVMYIFYAVVGFQ